MEIYLCKTCGSMMWRIHDGAEPVCCGNPMILLTPNTVDAAVEKHIPVVSEEEGKLVIQVGSVEHPMTPEHYIMWIAAVSDDAVLKKDFSPGEKPLLTVCDRGYKTFYAYCNLHGLWRGER